METYDSVGSRIAWRNFSESKGQLAVESASIHLIQYNSNRLDRSSSILNTAYSDEKRPFGHYGLTLVHSTYGRVAQLWLLLFIASR